ncbi:hypothetical protein NP493_519g05089 [Ridgeia piscesae]|uniref:Peptidase M20 domain-containing protein 2 n=1 Tax=Ridgeia piscesae TaxID=27915 RepID=A0AAD9KX58_RIDPI|nr:hypothetical protein NP493_519g05089 [Ridgeia piscesae]
MDTAARLKTLSDAAIDAAAGQLAELSRDIWSHPELNYEEKHAHFVLTAFLEDHGLRPQRHYVVDTAFRAEFGGEDGGPNVAVLCEYDALPELGHACGHNLIAEVGVGAALGIKAALEEALKEGRNLGKDSYLRVQLTLPILLKLLDAGAFRDVDCSLMAHPADANMVDASHASASPWHGINALDAAVIAYSSVSCLRQQMKPDERMHGVITNGGVKPNIIPEKAELLYYIRAPTLQARDILATKVYACFNAAATATGCSAMTSVYRDNMARYGVEEPPADHLAWKQVASSDVGNVSHAVPSIAPVFAIGTRDMPHSRGFAEAAGGPAAQAYTLVQAKLLAATAIDLYCTPRHVDTAKEQFEKYTREGL